MRTLSTTLLLLAACGGSGSSPIPPRGWEGTWEGEGRLISTTQPLTFDLRLQGSQGRYSGTLAVLSIPDYSVDSAFPPPTYAFGFDVVGSEPEARRLDLLGTDGPYSVEIHLDLLAPVAAEGLFVIGDGNLGQLAGLVYLSRPN